MNEKKTSNLFFLVCRVIAILIGFYQANKYFFSDGKDALEHLLYIGLDVILVFGLWKRPKWFVYFFGFFLAQQVYTQSSSFYDEWSKNHLFNVKSFAIICLMPIIFIALLKDRKHASQAP